MWNLLNYAAVTVPVGKADGELDQPRPGGEWLGYEPRNASDRFNHGQCEFLCPLRLGFSFGRMVADGDDDNR